MCESVRVIVQPRVRAGIGFGDWKKSWENISEEVKRGKVNVRVKENIVREREVQVGSLERQSRWGEWMELVLKTEMSWHTLFNYEDS